MPLVSLQQLAGRVANQSPRLADTLHDGVAGIRALGAVNALHLQAVADVDAGGTRLHAGAAVDAVAARRPARTLPFMRGSPRVGSYATISDCRSSSTDCQRPYGQATRQVCSRK